MQRDHVRSRKTSSRDDDVPLRRYCIGGQPPGDRLGRSPRAIFERCDLSNSLVTTSMSRLVNASVVVAGAVNSDDCRSDDSNELGTILRIFLYVCSMTRPAGRLTENLARTSRWSKIQPASSMCTSDNKPIVSVGRMSRMLSPRVGDETSCSRDSSNEARPSSTHAPFESGQLTSPHRNILSSNEVRIVATMSANSSRNSGTEHLGGR